MPVPEQGSLWDQMVSETIWGKRGVVKTITLSLPLAVMLSIDRPGGRQVTWIACLELFVAVGCWCLACILANDLTDREADRSVGKQRWISRLPAGAGVLAVTIVVGLGVLSLRLGGGGRLALGSYLAATALGVLYSLRPVRLKVRGLLGPLAYSSAVTLAFVAVPWAWLEAGWPALAVVALAVLLDKWVNLHFHQVIDCEADRSSGMRTYAALAGPDRARRSLKWAAALASLSMLGVLAFVTLSVPTLRHPIAGTGAVVALAVAKYAGLVRRRPDRASALLRELPPTYLGLTYAVLRILPLVLLARLAVEEATMWSVFGIVALLLAMESWHVFRYRYE